MFQLVSYKLYIFFNLFTLIFFLYLAIHSKHLVEYRDTPSSGMAIPTTIDVPFNTVPMNIIFRSASTKLNIAQQHQGTNGQTQMTHSDDGPIKIIHRVQKPIIQEIREIISPYRKITQEIMPVQEEVCLNLF